MSGTMDQGDLHVIELYGHMVALWTYGHTVMWTVSDMTEEVLS